MAQKHHDISCLIREDLSEDSVVEAEEVLDLRLGEAALGGGDVAGHVAHEEMAVPPLELCGRMALTMICLGGKGMKKHLSIT